MIANLAHTACALSIPLALLVVAIRIIGLIRLRSLGRPGVLICLTALALPAANASDETLVPPVSVHSFSWVDVAFAGFAICTVQIENVVLDHSEMASYDYHLSYGWRVWRPDSHGAPKGEMTVAAVLHKNYFASLKEKMPTVVRAEEIRPIGLSVTVPGRAAPIEILPGSGYPSPLPDGTPDVEAQDQLLSAVSSQAPVLVKMVMESPRFGTKTLRIASNLNPTRLAALKDCIQRGMDILHQPSTSRSGASIDPPLPTGL
jgi:hypothetical protein